MQIPFNKPYMAGKELWLIVQSQTNGHLSGDRPFTRLCHTWLELKTGAANALLTHSCGLVRLPLWIGLGKEMDRVLSAAEHSLREMECSSEFIE